ncbi:MAG: hypothetical protein GW762_04970 [Candidatus Pacebacteria bacterium]|nr:hypothetical protein [Candidatus Paceibacterota bacterium]PIR63960.1 MAG: hypothetical protein COU64_01775 [Candidatus Pacebacteria bacterium CG10_big_fil_rev_8_21_14_0_10_40_26]PIZ78659.1 MAG: hypothetical protein COY01_03440 [Candidatus Pacebacteria bacterium CG_4_10_14_0_2_um_filter_40_20]PJA68489.1 MAG: hypothetical protein CO156_05875 [Candidatus Pacebacteria bacterium CG_4_9_14_3_um_filter_40_12]PJC41882.1 MAG: hypothetical protein CO041_04140 [Candidatus Pacebacteria bacterium CG_4_9_
MSQLIYQFYSPKGLQKNKNVSNSSRLVLVEAEKYGVEWNILPGTQIITLTYNGKTQTYYHQVPSATTALAIYSTQNKRTTSYLLQNAGISVPKGYRIKKSASQEYLHSLFDNLQKPLVVKPSDGTWGENITVNIQSFEEFTQAIQVAFQYSGKESARIIVEEMFKGEEYRILATQEKVLGILNRRPASVMANGVDTIRKLIQEKNTNPIRGPKNSTCSHLKIRMDENLRKNLAEQNLTLDSIPPESERIFLRNVSNVSQGGDAIDYTDLVHPSVNEIALKAIKAIPGLSFAGLDMLSTDITMPQTDDSYVIIEINDSPGFDIHDYPYEGKNRHVARAFLFLMFPELKAV